MEGISMTPQQEKLKALQALLPEVFAEGKIDWEKLKATLGESINFSNERYILNWAGKSDAFNILQLPTTKTLIPAKDQSINFDNTQNIFIEGENLEVLKVLQKSYFGRVKMIYIDPPYNTGNDSFIYPDKFSETKEEYLQRVGDKDQEGYMTNDGMFRKNSKENGQYHSNWLNMMMPRLYLAKNLLKQDGVIFVSIDDNEVHNLRLLMNEIFGEENFVAEICHKSRASISNDKIISVNHNYILLYAKNERIIFNNRNQFGLEPKLDDFIEVDEKGNYKLVPVSAPGGSKKGNPFFSFKGIEGYYRFSEETMNKMYDDNFIVIKGKTVLQKYYLEKAKKSRKTDNTWWDEGFYTSTATMRLNEIMEGDFFTNPKSVDVVKKMIELTNDKDSIILDFFAGSSTTAHAVMALNKEDGGNRKYICVQLPELCDENSEAYKAGYSTIAEISKERIRRVGKKIHNEIEKEIANIELQITKIKSETQTAETAQKIEALQLKIENLQNQDLGFKVLKLADSNFKQWQQIEGIDAKTLEEQMQLFVDPVAEDAIIDNMVYEFLLKNGKDLNSKIQNQNDYYNINRGEIMILLEKATQEVVEEIISQKPLKVIALDRLFEGNDQLKTNTVLQMRDAGIEFKTL